MKKTQLERFWEKVVKTKTCWVWTGSLSAGYGHTSWNGKTTGAQRVSYWIHKGEIPKGLVLDHLCRVRNCVNPDHLEPVTIGENAARNGIKTEDDEISTIVTKFAHGVLDVIIKGMNILSTTTGTLLDTEQK